MDLLDRAQLRGAPAARVRPAEARRTGPVLREQPVEPGAEAPPLGRRRSSANRDPRGSAEPPGALRADLGDRLHPRLRGLQRLRLPRRSRARMVWLLRNLSILLENAPLGPDAGRIDPGPRAEAAARWSTRRRCRCASTSRCGARLGRDPVPQRGDEHRAARRRGCASSSASTSTRSSPSTTTARDDDRAR